MYDKKVVSILTLLTWPESEYSLKAFNFLRMYWRLLIEQCQKVSAFVWWAFMDAPHVFAWIQIRRHNRWFTLVKDPRPKLPRFLTKWARELSLRESRALKEKVFDRTRADDIAQQFLACLSLFLCIRWKVCKYFTIGKNSNEFFRHLRPFLAGYFRALVI